jgi:acyl-CoA dehydrogenase
LADVSAAVAAIGRHCASTAMVFAMHQIQVACIVRHGGTPFLHDYLREVADRQLLLASATTEVGIGGDTRTSACAVERHDGGFRLEKQAGVISYGENADAVLVTARRSPDSAPNDQVLVLCKPPSLTLEPTTGWDTLGFRGTCSLGFRLTVADDMDCVLPESFADISSQTMLPVSHILWASVWLGLATAAVDTARRYVQAEARKKPGHTPPSALRLAELMPVVQQMEETIRGAARRFDDLSDDRDALASIGFAIAMNSLKVSASTLVVDIVGQAMVICGMAGYREDSPYRLGRLLRDAHGAVLMINNDRINGNSAQMLLVHRGE